jgi:hypothetical protein
MEANMKTATKYGWTLLLGPAVVLGLLTGCQTWIPEAGVTLPSPRYIEHPPQYIPPSPPFPLPNELATQQATAAAMNRGPGVLAPLPPAAPLVPAQ